MGEFSDSPILPIHMKKIKDKLKVGMAMIIRMIGDFFLS